MENTVTEIADGIYRLSTLSDAIPAALAMGRQLPELPAGAPGLIQLADGDDV